MIGHNIIRMSPEHRRTKTAKLHSPKFWVNRAETPIKRHGKLFHKHLIHGLLHYTGATQTSHAQAQTQTLSLGGADLTAGLTPRWETIIHHQASKFNLLPPPIGQIDHCKGPVFSLLHSSHHTAFPNQTWITNDDAARTTRDFKTTNAMQLFDVFLGDAIRLTSLRLSSHDSTPGIRRTLWQRQDAQIIQTFITARHKLGQHPSAQAALTVGMLIRAWEPSQLHPKEMPQTHLAA